MGQATTKDQKADFLTSRGFVSAGIEQHPHYGRLSKYHAPKSNAFIFAKTSTCAESEQVLFFCDFEGNG